jgi:succinate-semialdehyde dehydrogenase / glutarate-semialdehyde dehydrogenase
MAYASINPYNGEVLKTFPVASDTEVEQILTNAHQAFLAWKDRSVSERCVILQHAADLLRVDANRYASLLTLEMGKITSEALAEVEISARIFEYYVQNAESSRWLLCAEIN